MDLSHIADARAALVRRDFGLFCQHALAPQGFRPAAHHRLLISKLQADPNGVLLAGGLLYGTTSIGGRYDEGTLYSLDPVQHVHTASQELDEPLYQFVAIVAGPATDGVRVRLNPILWGA